VFASGERFQDRLNLFVELPDCGDGGFRDGGGHRLASLDPIAQQALEPGWNDVRLSRTDGRVTVQLNGRRAASVAPHEFGRSAVRLGLLTERGGRSRWRYVRTRGGDPGPRAVAVQDRST
jgi:hypothetical protein